MKSDSGLLGIQANEGAGQEGGCSKGEAIRGPAFCVCDWVVDLGPFVSRPETDGLGLQGVLMQALGQMGDVWFSSLQGVHQSAHTTYHGQREGFSLCSVTVRDAWRFGFKHCLKHQPLPCRSRRCSLQGVAGDASSSYTSALGRVCFEDFTCLQNIVPMPI